MRKATGVLGFVLCMALAPHAMSAGDEAVPAAAKDPQFAQAVAAIKAHEYRKAIPLLTSYVARVKDDADAENYLGYANRKAGDLDAAFKHYNRALELNPKHRGVHEYIGEAYLMKGDLGKAEEHLKVLDKLCTFSCEEYRDLKASIAAYKTKQTASK